MMISRKLAHKAMNHLQILMALSDLIETTPEGWHFYDSNGEEMKSRNRTDLHTRFRTEVHMLADLLQRNVKA